MERDIFGTGEEELKERSGQAFGRWVIFFHFSSFVFLQTFGIFTSGMLRVTVPPLGGHAVCGGTIFLS